MDEETTELEDQQQTEAAAEDATTAAEDASDATTTAQAAATAAEESAQTAQSAAESAQQASSTVSERNALATQNKLLRDNLELVFRRLDQMGDVLNNALTPLTGTMDEMDATIELMQQVISRQDEQQEQLGVALAALAQVTSELMSLATRARTERTPTTR